MAGSGNRGHEFLRSILGFTEANAPVTSANKPIKLGRIDYEYNPTDFLGGVMPRVLFDGEHSISQKRYQVMSGYYPQPGARVVLVPVGTTYLIIGSVDTVPQDPSVQYFTESDVWEKPAGARMIRVQVQGGGGGGGGCVASAAGACCAGAGGAGGGYGESWLSANSVSATVDVTVGTGGTGGAGTALSGTTSSFGAYVSAQGGFGGGTTASSTTNAGISGGNTSSQVIVADLAIPGSGGVAGMRVPSGVSMGGAGGSSHLGGGGRGVAASGNAVAGTSGTGYGGGGGGAVSGISDNPVTSGGSGAPGIVIVTTFF